MDNLVICQSYADADEIRRNDLPAKDGLWAGVHPNTHWLPGRLELESLKISLPPAGVTGRGTAAGEWPMTPTLKRIAGDMENKRSSHSRPETGSRKSGRLRMQFD